MRSTLTGAARRPGSIMTVWLTTARTGSPAIDIGRGMTPMQPTTRPCSSSYTSEGSASSRHGWSHKTAWSVSSSQPGGAVDADPKTRR